MASIVEQQTLLEIKLLAREMVRLDSAAQHALRMGAWADAGAAQREREMLQLRRSELMREIWRPRR